MNDTVFYVMDINDPPQLNIRQREEIGNLKNKQDDAIDYSDIGMIDESFWSGVVSNDFYSSRELAIRVRIDKDTFRWLSSAGKDYRSRINEILRQAMRRDRYGY